MEYHYSFSLEKDMKQFLDVVPNVKQEMFLDLGENHIRKYWILTSKEPNTLLRLSANRSKIETEIHNTGFGLYYEYHFKLFGVHDRSCLARLQSNIPMKTLASVKIKENLYRTYYLTIKDMDLGCIEIKGAILSECLKRLGYVYELRKEKVVSDTCIEFDDDYTILKNKLWI